MRESIKCIVIGVSAGGSEALQVILPKIPEGFQTPIVIVQHMMPSANEGFLVSHYGALTNMIVEIAEDKANIEKGHLYFAPPGFHLLIEDDQTFSLSLGEKVCYSRPSIDVLFESAAFAYGSALAGIVLTGANFDGAAGLRAIEDAGGFVVAEDPDTANTAIMPKAAIMACRSCVGVRLPYVINSIIEQGAE